MRGFLFNIEGNWAHFKKPETNNNPLTHDFITKSALVGLIGAVLGIEREKMRPLFPQLCEDLLYGVQTVNPVKKESWGFTLRKAVNLFDKAPKQMECCVKMGSLHLVPTAPTIAEYSTVATRDLNIAYSARSKAVDPKCCLF